MIDLDANATTRPLPEVVAAVTEALVHHWHNPSSVHRAGQEARRAVELARDAVAQLIAAPPRAVTFTSGGTEAINLAVRGTLEAGARRTIVTTPIEHAAGRELFDQLTRQGLAQIRLLPLDRSGVVETDALRSLLDDSVALVSVQWANNETGAVQPVHAIGGACRARGILFHCDGTQWVGKMPVGPALDEWCDLLTFSPHKFHGPKGVGVLWARRGVRLAPQQPGAQEQGRRAGTENVPGIVGAGVAAAAAESWLRERPDEIPRLAGLRDRFERAVLEAAPDSRVNGPHSSDPHVRLWNTTNIAFPRLEAEALLLAMSERGLAASAGAACSSGSLDPSPVLLAMGVPREFAHGSIRFSMSRFTTDQDIAQAVQLVPECVARVRRSMAPAPLARGTPSGA